MSLTLTKKHIVLITDFKPIPRAIINDNDINPKSNPLWVVMYFNKVSFWEKKKSFFKGLVYSNYVRNSTPLLSSICMFLSNQKGLKPKKRLQLKTEAGTRNPNHILLQNIYIP